FAISLFPSWRDLSEAGDNMKFHQAQSKRDLLKQAVQENNLPNLHFCHGPQLMPTFQGLGDDLLHIGDHGFVQIAEYLAPIIRKQLSQS
ncbi:MAG: hypothetical protein LC725_11140, partial [Lentisphaerae bacterium]|nr:hypothetical protein [Lentisphaerota bacterium]